MYRDFATLVSYPRPDLSQALDAAIRALAHEFRESTAMLEKFRESTAPLTDGELEELYIQTFEMRAEGALYVGHQIFGEDWRRGIFMAGLRERYRALGISEGLELPDHLSTVLRCLEVQELSQEKDELIGDCIIPAVRKMLQAIEGESPYSQVLNALLLCLPPPLSSEPEFEDFSCRPSSSSPFPILR